MPAFIVHARERSILERNPITAAQIAAAFREGPPTGNPSWGALIGPAPRITRNAVIGDAFTTDAAWLYAIPDDAYQREHPQNLTNVQNVLRDRLTASLRTTSSDWSPVEFIPYDPNAHGDPSWWLNAQGASNTRTKDAYPILAARLDRPENPIGPDSAVPHPTTATDLVPWVAGGAVSLGLLWVAAQWAGASRVEVNVPRESREPRKSKRGA